MFETILTSFATSFATSATVAAFIWWLTRTFIHERLKLENNERLAAFEATLKKDGDASLERLRTTLKKETDESLERLRISLQSAASWQAWAKQREDAIAAQYREEVRSAATAMASALHSMRWLTWAVREKPAAITPEKIDRYDKEIHELLPKITGSLATIAAFDFPTYNDLRSLAEQLFELDDRISTTCLEFDYKDSDCISSLKKCWEEAQAMDRRLPQAIADIIVQRVNDRANRVLKEATDLS
jgi:hypothetical protein